MISTPLAAEVQAGSIDYAASQRNMDHAVAFLHVGAGAGTCGHDAESKRAVARSIADLLNAEFNGDYDPSNAPATSTLIVPSDTIETLAEAHLMLCPCCLAGSVAPTTSRP